MVGCAHVFAEVRDYFHRELDRNAKRRKERARQALRQQDVAAEGNVNVEDDEDLQAAMRLSREEEKFRQRQRMYGGQFEQCVGGSSGAVGSSQGAGGSSQGVGASSQGGGEGLFGMMRRSMSQKSCSREWVQIRIDTGPWTAKSKLAKSAIKKPWSKFFHTEAIAGRKADNPYFISAIKETQRWGTLLSFSLLCSQYICTYFGHDSLYLQVRAFLA